MARVEHDPEGRPQRLILGYRRHSGTLYVVYPVSNEEGTSELLAATFAFLGNAQNPVPVDSIPKKMLDALQARAEEVLQHVLFETEESKPLSSTCEEMEDAPHS